MFLASGGFGRTVLFFRLKALRTQGYMLVMTELDPRGEPVSPRSIAPTSLHKCYLGPEGPMLLSQGF